MTEAARDPREFGRRLQRWRRRNRLTQGQLADALGYDENYVAKIEGGFRPPSRAFLSRLAQLTGASEEGLLRGPPGDIARAPLPQPPDVLVGRDGAVEELLALLRGPARCVTLVGPPGVGKTALAMELAVRLDRLLPDGSWWVSLLEAARPDEVGHRLRRALGVADGGEVDPVEAALARLRHQECLLVLDNFEHVIEARPIVRRVLDAAPRTTVLVTSREALGLLSEHAVPVAPLPFPPPDSAPTIGAVRASPAVELFAARAAMARPGFEVTAANYEAVLSACSHLDGLPLAIVLAAGAVRTMAPDRLAERLAEQLDLPVPAPADLPPHQRSLDAAVRWSWQLLSPPERSLLATLSAFPGGATPGAAAAVNGLDPGEADGLLDDLARKSLVEARPDSPAGPRFELLETVRSFARRQLERSGREAEVRRRHAAWFAAFADEHGRGLLGHGQARSRRALAQDRDNLEAAFAWALEAEPGTAAGMAAALWRFFLIGDIPTGRRWLDAALAAAPEPTAARATALAAAGALGWLTGDAAAAARSLAAARALAADLDLPEVTALALVNEGALAEQQDRLDDAEACFSEALALADRLGDGRGRAVALNGLGMVRRRRGDLRGAWPLWTEAAALFRAAGDRFIESIALGNLAWAAEVEGRLDEAAALSGECKRIQVALGDARGLAATTVAFGRIAYRRGAYEEARSYHLEALAAFHRLGDLPWAASTVLALAAVEERSGAPDRAATLLAAARALWERIGAGPREEEQDLIDRLAVACAAALDDGALARAGATGAAMTVGDALALAAAGTAGGGSPEAVAADASHR
jgi:predicted ATPase